MEISIIVIYGLLIKVIIVSEIIRNVLFIEDVIIEFILFNLNRWV